ncbi:hypothetical protein AUEXF2481DRAFT_36502 [Aureobasidium subglaciale EXF-2481]|uniref:Sacsin/Nov domain-containing protein n=1 Tax=Aureobasidium subglaciale (strain EXF-2481) TaxID=1043005 RepID=A0A074YST1_AURSE|nr:uncharacterized protein AUEXF2481DRAFT_36502 [Aureobasidium subglaciale EXF-2481]KEQ99194.1 hypothetical protein AUEXF2481DRAFT_36502 [Aureobasidium subglaciale EXF-2481]
MAGSIDYARLREQTMGSGLDEEAVTVNTRALIDKVLARYSGEWTTLRELIQNAADAQATKVSIKFETLPSPNVPVPPASDPSAQLKHVLTNHTLQRLLVSNNGQAFAETDWQRLKRIAEGNPDETKIGAFGVGFYSVFADCENPFVSSGDQTMAFYWKGNSLFTRRGRLPKEQATGETAFVLDYRNTTSPVPNLLSICQFLATSLTFVGLQSVELWIDGWNMITLNKKMAPSAAVAIPNDINPKTKAGLMKIVGVEYQNAQIDATWCNVIGWTRVAGAQQQLQPSSSEAPTQSLRGFFSRFASAATGPSAAAKRAAKEEEAVQRAIAEDLAGSSTASVFLRISTVNVQTYVNKSLSAELERATKKPPPKHTKIAILTSSYDESSVSMATFSGSSSGKASEIFASVLPSKNGRVFIGFPTAQTTGLLAHISAPSVIPTVERESIDLNARWVRDWNVEMLRVAGIACRVAYTGDMAELKNKLERQMITSGNKKVQKEDIEAVMASAIHTFKQYTFSESTPSSQVGAIIEEAFWTCNQKGSINLLSTRGVLPSFEVRVATEDLSFVDGIPVVPDEIMEKAAAFMKNLKEYGLLSDITTHDIKKELEARALEEKQLTELIKWATGKLSRDELDVSALHSLFDGTVATIAEEFTSTYPSPVLLLGSIDSFPNPSKVPSELPASSTTIPFRFVKNVPKNQLEAFGWTELQIVPWLRYLIEKDGAGLSAEQSVTKSPQFSGQVLSVVSKSWDGLSQSSKGTVVQLLEPRTVIPTKLGMRKPAQSYFASVKLFDDLPTVHGLQGVKEKFLLPLGVRKTVELSVVFERLMAKSSGAAEGKWSHVDLIKYLVSVQGDIPNEDYDKLRKTPICPAESQGDAKATEGKLYKVSDLYEPLPILRELGLPLVQWPGEFRKASPESKFLSVLGLKAYPGVQDLILIMTKAAAEGDSKLYEKTLQYYITNHYANGYRTFPVEKVTVPFLPLQGGDLKKLAIPTQCFANKRSAILGFQIIREDLQKHAALFNVEQNPPITICADRLMKSPPKSRTDAKDVFSYFAGRLNEIGASGNLAEKLGESRMIPIVKVGSGSEKSDNIRYTAPRACFLGDSATYGEIFDFVDFGSEANSFLLKVGSKHEPSAPELGGMLVREPSRLLGTLGQEKYLSLLRRIADNASGLKNDKMLWGALKRSPCLLAVKEIAPITSKVTEDEQDYFEENEAAIKEWHLAVPSSIILVDDFYSYRLFKERLLAGPQEEILENLYAGLGATWISSLIEDDQRMGALLPDQSTAARLQNLIVERCRLFLHDHTADAIRHDSKWLEGVLAVNVVGSLTLTKTLRGYNATYKEKRTAALHRDTKKDATLFVTTRPDFYEVARAIMSLLLKRAKQQDFLALEMILESDLRRLKTKGYNVDRILRQKAAENRMAENKRQQQMEEEQKRMTEREAEWNAQQQTRAIDAPHSLQATPEKSKPVPGAFEASPETTLAQRPKRGTGFFSNLQRQLGFETGSTEHPAEQQRQKQLQDTSRPEAGPSDAPPPYSENPGQVVKKSTVSQQPEKITPPHQITQNLISAVNSSRAHDSSSLFSPPAENTVKETPSYCDSSPGHDLTFVGNTSAGVKIFLANAVPASSRATFLQTHATQLNAFAALLLDVGNVFLLRPQSLHIYYNESGSSIAFNRQGSIFCNLRYFLQLHWQNYGTAGGVGKQAAAVYWYVTLCHELAHNLVSEHSQQHEFYTESFVTEYFGKMMGKCSQYAAEPPQTITQG